MNKKAMKLALDALESCDAAHITDGGHQWYDERLVDKAITALREALAEQPAQRTWVGLTDEEKRQLFDREDYQGWLDYINAIEAKLRSKNEDRN